MAEDNNQLKLLNTDADSYGVEYNQHLLEQYKLYVSSAENISDRRQRANTYFIALNAALISFYGASNQFDLLRDGLVPQITISILGLIVSVVFWFLIRAYKQLNTGKFLVIHEIEKELPLSIYRYEWEKLEKGENWKAYFPFSHIELTIPIVFGAFYVLFAIKAVHSFFC